MPRAVPVMRFAVLGVLGVLLTVVAYTGRHSFRAQSIPIDSLYVNGTAGEEMGGDYVVPLQYGSNLRFRWNMNTVSTRDGYSIYCGLQKNNGGYQIVEPERDAVETIAQPTKFDFECRSCRTGTESSCFQSSNGDYITTYQRTLSAYIAGQAPVLPASSSSSNTAPASQTQLFNAQGTAGEKLSGDVLTLNEGSGVQLSWNMNDASTRDGYSIFCAMQRNGGGHVRVEPEMVDPVKETVENPLVPTTYDLECRSCPTYWGSYCFDLSAPTDYITTYRRIIQVSVKGAPATPPPPFRSGNSVTMKPSYFVARGTLGEKSSGENLTLGPGSQARLAWYVPTELRETGYHVYCGFKKDGGTFSPVPTSKDFVEQLSAPATYEFACRTCQHFGYSDPSYPWNTCWDSSNVDFTEIIRKKVSVSRSAYCGDSKISGSEQCDDGTNTTPGDGCSMNCTIEPGWVCAEEPSKCNKCGNAVREGRETCDDGNTANGDGCDALCFAEPGYKCLGTSCTSIACNDGIDNDGDGLIDFQENGEPVTHLFGNEAHIRAYLNGISALITPDPLQENEFVCTQEWVPLRYDEVRAKTEEEMDDSAADKFCRLFQWDEAITSSCVYGTSPAGMSGNWSGEQMIRTPLWFPAIGFPHYGSIRCANSPDCSDGKDNDFDGKIDMADGGCTNKNDTSELAADSGCFDANDPSEGSCGDGVKEPAEQCDDGNIKTGDGCSATCLLERGAAPAAGAASAGTAPTPSSRSSLTSGPSATTAPLLPPTSVAPLLQPASSTQPNRCGDGARGNAEECDDGNRQNGDGCSATCLYEGLPPPRSSVRSVAFAVSSTKPASPVPAAQAPKPAAVSSVRQSTAPIPALQTLTASSAAPLRTATSSVGKSSLAPLPPVQAVVSSAAGIPPSIAPVAMCGNGKTEAREQCDRGPANSLAPDADCRPDCTFGRCGDGILDPRTEECDDGRYDDGDGCSSRCLTERPPSAPVTVPDVPAEEDVPPILSLTPSPVPAPASSAASRGLTAEDAPLPVLVEHAAAPVPVQEFPLPSGETPLVAEDIAPAVTEWPVEQQQMYASSSTASEAAPVKDAFSVWHLPMLRPDIFPTQRVAEEALLFVQERICRDRRTIILPYLPYFQCERTPESALGGHLLGRATGSASLGMIAALLLAGMWNVRARRSGAAR